MTVLLPLWSVAGPVLPLGGGPLAAALAAVSAGSAAAGVVAGRHLRRRGRARPAAAGLSLSKAEAFELCECLAEAERALVRAGRDTDAAAVSVGFELVEGRLLEPSA